MVRSSQSSCAKPGEDMNGVGQTEIRPRARARRESSPTYYICHAELTTIFTTERYGAPIHSWTRKPMKDRLPCGTTHDSDRRNVMNQRNSLSLYGKVTVAALLVAAVGIVIQYVSGVDFPTVPPGLIILLVAAGLVAFGPWRWAPVVGMVVGLFLIVGFFASGQIGPLLDPGWFGRFVGVWVLFLSVVVAFVAGTVATIQNFRVRREEVG